MQAKLTREKDKTLSLSGVWIPIEPFSEITLDWTGSKLENYFNSFLMDLLNKAEQKSEDE